MEPLVAYLLVALVVVVELYRLYDIRKKGKVLEVAAHHNALLNYTILEVLKDIRRHIKEEDPSFYPLLDDINTSIKPLMRYGEVLNHAAQSTNTANDQPT